MPLHETPGYVPPGPQAANPRMGIDVLPNVQVLNAEQAALNDLLVWYMQGGIATPESLWDNAQYYMKESPATKGTFTPDFADRALRAIGFRRTPTGQFERLHEGSGTPISQGFPPPSLLHRGLALLTPRSAAAAERPALQSGAVPNVVEQLRQIEGFDQLPQDRQEALIVDALEKETQGGVGAPSAPSTTPGYQGLGAFHEGGTVERAVPQDFGQTLRSVLAGNMSVADALKVTGLRGMGATFGSEPRPAEAEALRGVPSMVGSLVGTGLGAAGGPAGMAIGDLLGTGAGYGLEVALGATQPTLQDMALQLGIPLAANAWQAIRPVVRGLARSSSPGKMALKTQADDAVAAFNARVQAEYAQANAQREAVKAQRQFQYQNDLEAWRTVEAQQAAEKARYAEQLRGFTQAYKEGNVAQVATYMENVPGIPSKAQYQESYRGAQEIADNYKTPIVLDEIQAVKKQFLDEAGSLKKITGDTPLTRQLESLARAGTTTAGPVPLTLTDIQSALASMNAHIASLKRSTGEYAGAQLRTYSRLVEATEDGLKKLAANEGLPGQFQLQLKVANAEYLKARTHAELTDFLTHDMLQYGPGGGAQFTPQRALHALENKSNAQLKRYMQQTHFEELGGKNLYELTQETLQAMAQAGVTEQQRLRMLKLTGGMTAPPQPSDPTANWIGVAKPQTMTAPRIDTGHGTAAILADAALRVGGPLVGLGLQQMGLTGGMSPYTAMGIGGVVTAGAPNLLAQLMMRPGGQQTLVTLIETQGTRLTPPMMGFLSAATRSQIGQEGGQP